MGYRLASFILIGLYTVHFGFSPFMESTIYIYTYVTRTTTITIAITTTITFNYYYNL